MTDVLITAFEPYEPWQANASWLTLVEITKQLPDGLRVTTRLFPVDFDQVRQRLQHELARNFDLAIHLGQAPGSGAIQLEELAINVRGDRRQSPTEYEVLEPEGPVAYRCHLPLRDWVQRLRASGTPAEVSFHAGTYLCNATFYWSHYFAERLQLATRSAFLHLPLDPTQVIQAGLNLASQPARRTAAAVHLILKQVAEAPTDAPSPS